MPVKTWNFKCLSRVLLSLVFAGLSGCAKRAQTSADTARIRLPLPSESMDNYVNVAAKKSPPPLWVASWDGRADIVKDLLEDGADVNAVSHEGGTPLCQASQNGHVEVVKLLLEAKADVNTPDIIGITPLMMASMNGHIDIVKLLLEAKADVNTKVHKGPAKNYTALTFARLNRHGWIITLLKEYGAIEYR